MADAFCAPLHTSGSTPVLSHGELLVGTPSRWAVDSALFFGLAPLSASAAWWVPAWSWAQLGVGQFQSKLLVGLLLGSAVAGVLGAAVGAAMPAALQWSRRRLPLAVLIWIVGMGACGLASVGIAIGAMAVGQPFSEVLGLVVGAMATVGWLPYTVASTMRRSPRTVLAGLLLGGPVFGLLARGVMALIFG